jgi:hypothetical protein
MRQRRRTACEPDPTRLSWICFCFFGFECFIFSDYFHIVLEAIVKAVWRRVRGSVDNGAAVLSETRQWRCMPWDLDEYRHMNNCAYFVFTEMGRRALLLRA